MMVVQFSPQSRNPSVKIGCINVGDIILRRRHAIQLYYGEKIHLAVNFFVVTPRGIALMSPLCRAAHSGPGLAVLAAARTSLRPFDSHTSRAGGLL